MSIQIEHIDYHRNGICGAPFHVILFRDPEEGRMVGVVFEEAYHVAVFNLDKLTVGNIAFGVNSWRGDRYEPTLRKVITEYQSADSQPEPERNSPMPIHTQKLFRIAQEHLAMTTLEVQRSDALDFHTVSVWAVHDALEAAYQAGKAASETSNNKEAEHG